MQNQLEEITLLSKRNANETCLQVRNSPPDFTSDNDDNDHRRILTKLINSSKQTSLRQNLLLWVILIGCLFIIAGPLALHYSYELPKIKSRTIPLNEFSEERARDFYPNLTQYGSRVSNTRGDYRTREFLLSEIFRIRSSAKASIQFELSLQNFSQQNMEGLQNIAVRLSNLNSSSKASCLMLSAHYDSVEFSPGASDDGSGIVILLELLSNLVNDPMITFTDVNLIVLFTSAEEMSLDGAQSFVKDHQWKDDIRRFINLDSIGGHEKAILFRVKPSQLIKDYAHVPRPHANVLGAEFLDLTGSDTDYSIFTKTGFLCGYDFAFYLDGYIYHTPADIQSSVENGALQHLGENILQLARNILLGKVDLNQSATIFDDENYIYFDVLGRYLIIYKISVSTIIQKCLISLILFVGLILIIIDHIWYKKHMTIEDFSSVYFYFKYPLILRIILIFFFLISYILTILLSICFTIIIALIISKFRPLSWFGNSTIAFFLYGLPCLISIILCQALSTYLTQLVLLKYPKKNPMEVSTIKHINRLYLNFERHWSLLLIFALLMSISIVTEYRSLYFILLWSIFMTPVYILLILFDFILRWKNKKFLNIFLDKHWYWLFAPYVISLIPLIHTFEITSRIARIAIPTMGRFFSLTPIPQDVIICLIIILPAILFFLIFLPNIQRTMNYTQTLIILTVSFVIVLIISCTRQPFTKSHPKLIHIQHSSLTIYKLYNPQTYPLLVPVFSNNSSIQINLLDRSAPSKLIKEIERKLSRKLKNLSCSNQRACSFDDDFNRTMPFTQVELTSFDIKSKNNYRFTFRHSSTFQLNVMPSLFINTVVHNATVKPRSETVIDVECTSLTRSTFNLTIEIERCDLSDSPFLQLLTEKLSHITIFGTGRCSSLHDTLVLSVYL